MASRFFPPGVDPCSIFFGKNPSGAPPNRVDPPNYLPFAVGPYTLLLVLLYICVGLRVAAIWKKDHRLKVDDCICLLASVLITTLIVFALINAKTVLHSWDMSWCTYTAVDVKLIYTPIFIQAPAVFLSKLLVCRLYLQAFGSIRWLRYTVYSVIVVFFAYSASYAITTIVGLARFVRLDGWSLVLTADIKTTQNKLVPLISIALFVVGDLVLLLSPVGPIMKLHLSLQKRLGILSIFLAGSAATAARIYTFFLWIQENYFGFQLSDSSWMTGPFYIISMVDVIITVIVGCLPGLGLAWRTILRESILVVRVRSFFVRFSACLPFHRRKRYPATFSELEDGRLATKNGFQVPALNMIPISVERPEGAHVRDATASHANTGER